MLNLNGWFGPVGFAVKMPEHFCPICVKLLMEEALQVIWPERKIMLNPNG